MYQKKLEKDIRCPSVSGAITDKRRVSHENCSFL
mgnify:FL=1